MDDERHNPDDSSQVEEYARRLNQYIKSLTRGDELHINELPELHVETTITAGAKTVAFLVTATETKHKDEFRLRTGSIDPVKFPTIVHPDNSVHPVDLITPHNETMIGQQARTLDYDRLFSSPDMFEDTQTTDAGDDTNATFTIPTDATRVGNCVYCEKPLHRFTPESAGEEIVYCSDCHHWAYAAQYDASPKSHVDVLDEFI